MERKLRLLEEEIRKYATMPKKCKEIPPAPRAKETLVLESNLESLIEEIRNVNKSVDVLKRNLVEFTEQHHVLKKASAWLENNQLVEKVRKFFSFSLTPLLPTHSPAFFLFSVFKGKKKRNDFLFYFILTIIIIIVT